MAREHADGNLHDSFSLLSRCARGRGSEAAKIDVRAEDLLVSPPEANWTSYNGDIPAEGTPILPDRGNNSSTTAWRMSLT